MMEYLTEVDPLTFVGELLEVPDDVLESTIGDAYGLAEEEDLQDIRQRVLQDMRTLAENGMERLILRHSKHLRNRLEQEE